MNVVEKEGWGEKKRDMVDSNMCSPNLGGDYTPPVVRLGVLMIQFSQWKVNRSDMSHSGADT